MKFLLFNLVVAGSLYYLFNAGDMTPPMLENQAQASVAQTVQSVAPTSEVKMEKEDVVTDSHTPPAPLAELPKENPTPVEKKVAASKLVMDTPATKPQTRPAAKPRKRPAPALPPEVAQRRAEVLGEVPVTSVLTIPAPTLMSPSIRRQELHALAEEMEYRSLGWRID